MIFRHQVPLFRGRAAVDHPSIMSLLYPVRISQDRRWTVTLIAVAPCITVVTRMEVPKRPHDHRKTALGLSPRRACFGEVPQGSSIPLGPPVMRERSAMA